MAYITYVCSELDSPQDVVEDASNTQDDFAILEKMIFSDVGKINENCADPNENPKIKNIMVFSIHVDFEPTTYDFCGAWIESEAQRTIMAEKHAK